MIAPTVGRVVWYYTGPSAKPLAAIIAHVHSDRMVNLMTIDSNGIAHAKTSVTLIQDDDEIFDGSSCCKWMPYQLGQAAKLEGKPNG